MTTCRPLFDVRSAARTFLKMEERMLTMSRPKGGHQRQIARQRVWRCINEKLGNDWKDHVVDIDTLDARTNCVLTQRYKDWNRGLEKLGIGNPADYGLYVHENDPDGVTYEDLTAAWKWWFGH